MAAVRNVINALRADEVRQALREGTADEWGLLEESDGDGSSEDETEQPERRASDAWWSSTRRLGNVLAVKCVGVRGKRLRTFGRRLEDSQTEAQKAFVAEVLHSRQLMVKCYTVLRSFQEWILENQSSHEASGPACERTERTTLMSLAAKMVHRIKVCTAQILWKYFLLPEREQNKKLQIRYASIQERFQVGREAYLKEVSSLRDTAWNRKDPYAGLHEEVDPCFFFDPKHILDANEQKFLLNSVHEKIKMLIEANPKGSVAIDMEQLKRLKQTVENNDLIETQELLAKQQQENAEQKKVLMDQLAEMNRRNQASASASSPREGQAGFVEELEKQLDDLRAEHWEMEQALKKERKSNEGVIIEREELAAALQDEVAAKKVLSAELVFIRGVLHGAQADSTSAKKELDDFKHMFEAQGEELALCRRSVHRQKTGQVDAGELDDFKHTFEAQDEELALCCQSADQCETSSKRGQFDAGVDSSICLPRIPRGGIVDAEQEGEGEGEVAVDASPPSDDAAADGGTGGSTAAPVEPRVSGVEASSLVVAAGATNALHSVDMEHLLLDAESRAQEAMQQRNELLGANRLLQEEKEELRTVLKRHLHSLMLRQADELMDDAGNLVDYAQALGCTAQEIEEVEELKTCTNTENRPRVCQCGNMLMWDSMFCRRCGSKWSLVFDADKGPFREIIVQCSVKLAMLDEQVNEAQAALNIESEGSLCDHAAVLALEADPDCIARFLEAGQRLANLKSERSRAESRMLVARARAAENDHVSSGSAKAGDCCNCAAELDATKVLVAKMRQLCSELAYKLQRSAAESKEMAVAFAQAQEVLSQTAALIREREVLKSDPMAEACLQNIAEATHTSVFQRLYSLSNERTLLRRDELMQQLLEQTSKVLYLDDRHAPRQEETKCLSLKIKKLVPISCEMPAPPGRTRRKLFAKEGIDHTNTPLESGGGTKEPTLPLNVPSASSAPRARRHSLADACGPRHAKTQSARRCGQPAAPAAQLPMEGSVAPPPNDPRSPAREPGRQRTSVRSHAPSSPLRSPVAVPAGPHNPTKRSSVPDSVSLPKVKGTNLRSV